MTPNTSASSNPFADFNPFANLDLGKFDFTKMMSDLKLPGLDVEALMAAQSKNIEAITAANQIVVKGMQDLAKRQSEIMSQGMHEVSDMVQNLAGKANNPQELTAKQVEMSKQIFEKTLANLRELAEMISKSSGEAMEVINKRIAESIEELKAMMPAK